MRILLGGIYYYVVRDWRGRVKARGKVHNAVTTAGMNYLLDTGIRNTAQVTAWYLSIIDNASFTAVAAADTMGSHTGWVEQSTNYSEATRPQWSPAAASAGLLSNAAAVVFTIATANFSAKGMFCTSVNTKGGTTGTLLSTAILTGTQALVVTDTWELTYQLEAQAVA